MVKIKKFNHEINFRDPKIKVIIAIAIVIMFIVTSFGSINILNTKNNIASNTTNNLGANKNKQELSYSAANTLPISSGSTINVGSSPIAIIVDQSNNYIYVANIGSVNVSVINGATDTVIASINVGIEPDGLNYDASNNYIYVPNWGSNNVSVINGATNTVIDSINVGSNPIGVTYDSSNNYIYVANTGSNNVSVINGATNTVIGSINVGLSTKGVTYDPSNNYIYVTNRNSNNVSVINGATDSVVNTINVGIDPNGISYDSSNNYIYVPNWGSNNVSVINGATNTVIDSINVGVNPICVGYDSSNNYIYTTNAGSNNVSVINGAKDTVIASINVGPAPNGVDFDQLNNNIYIANYGSDTISILSSSENYPVSWIFSPAFSIKTYSNDVSIKIGDLFKNYMFNLPISVYLITNASGISQQDFVKNVSKWFGIDIDLMNNEIPSESALMILNVSGVLGYLKELNMIYNNTAGIGYPINLVGLISPELDNNNLTFFAGLSFKNPSLHSALNVLKSAFSALIDQLKGGSIQIMSIANFVNAYIKYIGSEYGIDVGNLVAAAGNELTPGFQINSASIFEMFNNGFKVVNKIYSDTGLAVNFLTDITLSTIYTFLLDFPSALLKFAEGVVNGLDLALNFIAPNNPITSGWNWVTKLVDPNGTTILPTIYHNDNPVLGYYNNSFNWSSTDGLVIEAGNQWLILDTNITNSSFELTHVGSNNTTVPYMTFICSPRVNGTISSGIIPFNSNIESNVSIMKSNVTNYTEWSNVVTLRNVTYNITKGILSFQGKLYHYNSLKSGDVGVYLNGVLLYKLFAPDGEFNGSLNLTRGNFSITFEPYSNNSLGQAHTLYLSIKYYNVEFTENGLTSGTSWSVTFNGTTLSSTTNTITFSLPNGTYSYSIGKISGYNISKSSGSITVNGKNVTQSITFSSVPSTTPPPKKPSPSSNTDLYIIIGAVAAVAVVGAVVAIMVRKRK